MITYSSNAYLKGVNKYKYYQTRIEDKIITIKKLIDAEKFILNEDGNDILLLDNGFYILEIIPLNENYICRCFIDDKLNLIETLYILSNKNELVDGIPTYESLKLTYVVTSDIRKIYHENSLIKLKEANMIDLKKFIYLNNYFNNLIHDIDNLNSDLDYKNLIRKIGEL
ncbi:MAG TPA: hypothetical protein IAC20_05130 [Candidatus Faecisoma merdavium]|nr:hypothetical protein [Candidatus Faecisoma merdavium]